MSDENISCVEPAGDTQEGAPAAQPASEAAVAPRRPVARVGAKAPDFGSMAFVDGSFKKVSLSDYRGQWTMICFYPGDFTFV
jgi:hypothetical protein